MRARKSWSRRTVLALGAGLPSIAWSDGLGALAGWDDEPGAAFSLRNATVVTDGGRVLRQSGVRVERGRIVAVGTDVVDGEDLQGDWLVPGFVDAASHLATLEIDQETETHDDHDGLAEAPAARAWDGYNPLSETVAVARLGGITHSVVCPKFSGLVPGQAGLVQTAGRTLAETVLQAPLALCIGGGRQGVGGADGAETRVAVARRLRAWADALPTPKEAPARRKKGLPEPDETDTAAVLRAVAERRLKVLVRVDRADDIERAVAWLDETGLDGVLLGCAEGWVVADVLANAAVPVVLGPLMVQPDSFQHPHARYDNAAQLYAAGVPLAFGSLSNHFSRGLRVDAGVLVAHGLPWEAAVHALTAGAGEAYGVPGLGRLAPGAPASFFRASGDPLQPRTRVHQVWVGGRRCSMTSRQTRLYEQFRTL